MSIEWFASSKQIEKFVDENVSFGVVNVGCGGLVDCYVFHVRLRSVGQHFLSSPAPVIRYGSKIFLGDTLEAYNNALDKEVNRGNAEPILILPVGVTTR